jgi:glyoxylase-like metal-dependent hydrolase (beta-lactamase superfamily II)
MISGVASATLAAATARAAAPLSGTQAPSFYRVKVGSFEVTAVTDGFWDRPVDAKFVRNAPWSAVQRELARSYMPKNKLSIPFTPLVVNTGSKLVMIDCGSGGQIAPTAGSLLTNLAAAGFDAKTIDAVLISNFHPDHINGLKTKDDEVVFPNATVLVPSGEWSFWNDDGQFARARTDVEKAWFRNARRVFGGIGSKVTPFDPGKELVPGITAVAAPGHTPGHSAFAIASGNASLLALCDVTNHPWLFARHPDWQPTLDMDGPLAVRTRRRLLDRASADRSFVAGYHFPFPTFGHIAKVGAGYEFVPAMWRETL